MMYENLFTEALRKRRDPDLCCRNALFVGNPGDGLHFCIKSDAIDIITNTNDDVIILDTFGEVGPELDSLGTIKYNISPWSNVLIDPLSVGPLDPTRTAALDVAEMLSSMMKSTTFSTVERQTVADSIIYNIVSHLYQTTTKLSMKEVLLELEKSENSDVKFSARILQELGFLSEGISVDFSNRLTVLDLGHFKFSLRAGAVIPILHYLLSALKDKFNKTGKYTWVYILHLDALLEKDLDGFINRFWRKARTCGIVCTGGAYKDSLKALGLSDFIPNNNLYLLRPFQKSEEWLEVYDINTENIGSSTQLAFVLENETGTVPPYPTTT